MQAPNIDIGVYRHFKGNDYFALGVAWHISTVEYFVFYKALYGDGLFLIRPYDMFTDTVDRNGASHKRFLLTDKGGKPSSIAFRQGYQTIMPLVSEPYVVAIHSETGDKFVVHRGMMGDQSMIVRPLGAFMDSAAALEDR